MAVDVETDLPLDVRALEEALRERVRGEVRFDAGSRGAYATDGSNYRQVPIGVVVPRDIEAGTEAVAVCARFGAPVLSRGGGTSLGGQCTNTAVVIDWTKYCHHLVSLDAERRTCVVEPGIVLDELNRQLSGARLKFGPKPSTHSHCSLGGMIGNNSCGGSAQAYGKTVDNVRRLEILTYDGIRCWVGPTSKAEYASVVCEGGPRALLYEGLRSLTDRYLADIRHGFPDIPRRVSGYNLDSLLPESTPTARTRASRPSGSDDIWRRTVSPGSRSRSPPTTWRAWPRSGNGPRPRSPRGSTDTPCRTSPACWPRTRWTVCRPTRPAAAA